MLSLHPRTIRRYLRAGTLKGSKIGGEWRIHKADLQALLGNSEVAKELKDSWEMDVAEFIRGKQTAPVEGYKVCTIVDCTFPSSGKAQEVSAALLGIVNQVASRNQETRFQYSYESETGQARFILWGHPEYIAEMMHVLSAKAGREE